MSRGMELFLHADGQPFSKPSLNIACNRDCDVSYRLLYHVLIWRYMKKFFEQRAIPIEFSIPHIDSIHGTLRMEEYYGWDIQEKNGTIFLETLEYCGWRHLSMQFDFLLPGDTPGKRIRAIKEHFTMLEDEDYRKMVQFQEVVEEAYELEFGNYFVMLSNQEIGWYKGFAATHASWLQEHFMEAHLKIVELMNGMDEPFYQQFSVNSGMIDGKYVVAFSMGREEEHFVEEETLNMNWIISAHIVHELINIIREEWERKEKKIGYDASGASGICGVSEKI